VALILDTGIVYAYYDRSDDWHERARTLIAEERHALILPTPAITEIDHLLRHRIGVDACRALYLGLTDGSYVMADLPSDGYRRVAALNTDYPELGFVDAAIVAIAEARDVRRIGTTDRRHFGPLAGPLSLTLLP